MEAGTLSGRYETAERLGSGGMSNVYKATDRILERQVAVKILAEHLSDDERFVARFRREALAVARLIHPNIVQVYDSGVDDGRHYIVMEYVAGRSGAQILQRHGPVDADTAGEIGIQACAGLDYAHRRGIIHRDVKPGNLMITGGPVGSGELVVKLTDFGIARAIEQTRITQVGSVVGTAAYLSPEQVRGDEATPGTDVYALGVVLYQFLTGRLPYEGSSLAELAVRQQNERPLPPSTYNSEVPEPLSAAVLRALEGDTSKRYASADEFATGLQMGLEGEDVTRIESIGGEGNTPTRVLGGDTAATRHLDRTTAQTEYRPAPPPARRLEPRREPEPRRAAPYAGDPQPARAQPNYAAAQPRKRSAFSKFVRFVLALVALVLVAGAVATGVILTTDKAAGVHISKVAGDTVDKVVEEFKGLVSKNKE
jgi:eukaryotic-like serine/threonine-protein kinase